MDNKKENKKSFLSKEWWIGVGAIATVLALLIALLNYKDFDKRPEQRVNEQKLPKIIYLHSSSTAQTNAEKIKALLLGLGVKVPEIKFVLSKYSINNEIRYFFDNDFLSVVEIQKILSEQNIEATIRYIPETPKAKRGTIELWLK